MGYLDVTLSLLLSIEMENNRQKYFFLVFHLWNKKDFLPLWLISQAVFLLVSERHIE